MALPKCKSPSPHKSTTPDCLLIIGYVAVLATLLSLLAVLAILPSLLHGLDELEREWAEDFAQLRNDSNTMWIELLNYTSSVGPAYRRSQRQVVDEAVVEDIGVPTDNAKEDAKAGEVQMQADSPLDAYPPSYASYPTYHRPAYGYAYAKMKCCCTLQMDYSAYYKYNLRTSYACPVGPKGERGRDGDVGADGIQGTPGARGNDYPQESRPRQFGIPTSFGQFLPAPAQSPLPRLMNNAHQVASSAESSYRTAESGYRTRPTFVTSPHTYCGSCPQGPPGVSGLPGRVGARGAIGIAGLPGKHGLPGGSGASGPDGDVGIKGVGGRSGVAGTKGLDGCKTATGLPGAKGSQGANGAQGQRGVPGAQGSGGGVGLRGDQGIQGIRGQRGMDGIEGREGGVGVGGKDAFYCKCPSRNGYPTAPSHTVSNTAGNPYNAGRREFYTANLIPPPAHPQHHQQHQYQQHQQYQHQQYKHQHYHQRPQYPHHRQLQVEPSRIDNNGYQQRASLIHSPGGGGGYAPPPPAPALYAPPAYSPPAAQPAAQPQPQTQAQREYGRQSPSPTQAKTVIHTTSRDISAQQPSSNNYQPDKNALIGAPSRRPPLQRDSTTTTAPNTDFSYNGGGGVGRPAFPSPASTYEPTPRQLDMLDYNLDAEELATADIDAEPRLHRQ